MQKQLHRNTGTLMALLLALVLMAGAAWAQDGHRHLKADLTSFKQVPSVLATSTGIFEAEIREDGTLTYSLTYANMSSPVVQAHIHFGASKTNGGVIVFLCGNLNPTPCPASGTVTGTLSAADVSLLPSTNTDSVIPQGIQPGDFTGLLKAIETGNAYVNVHTVNFPGGEIRGQIQVKQ